ncbi:MAG: hypothetical protein ACLGI6_06975 [Gammaproteobacteria bacterium]
MTWSDLLASESANAARSLAFLVEDIGNLPDIDGDRLTMAYAGCSGVLARALLFCDSAAARVLVDGFHPHLGRVMQELARTDETSQSIVQWLLDFALLSECVGTPRPAGFDSALLDPLLAARTEFGDVERRALAFTALALGDSARALAFLDQQPGQYEWPVLRVEFNQFELNRYLAHVLEQERPADWIEPAWLEYLSLFPLHVAAKAAKWPDLFNVARVLANVRGDPVGQIAEDLHARVRLLASQGQ